MNGEGRVVTCSVSELSREKSPGVAVKMQNPGPCPCLLSPVLHYGVQESVLLLSLQKCLQVNLLFGEWESLVMGRSAGGEEPADGDHSWLCHHGAT